ncbi:hypothetical protein A2Y83_03785 [Candidatus Falkowbacteria bacterium RBG_13_39_14]|uniref:Uncharacterized protein n=1 Tax=Candidatus Falkowbacteria bacterium RBG_13_39_14 TaxID=1797985 RepID=A0A1F5S7U4_9BACT|nr:MAG: hypothetical protein A2Y83_03785 [Candidatus Falkowbacteria bacterium RBG_13_39_14]
MLNHNRISKESLDPRQVLVSYLDGNTILGYCKLNKTRPPSLISEIDGRPPPCQKIFILK